nr:haloacid dehalogenase [Desulfobacterales bacterium]
MIDPKAIAFDIDGVFADTMGLFLYLANTKYGVNTINYHDITSYFLEECIDMEPRIINEIIDLILGGSYNHLLHPLEGAVEVLTRVGAENPLLFVTARPNLETIKDWIYQKLPLSPSRIDIVATGSFEGKADVLLRHGIRYFVEDHLETCFLLKERGIAPIVFSQPWNRSPHPFMEVQDWKGIEKLIVSFPGQSSVPGDSLLYP